MNSKIYCEVLGCRHWTRKFASGAMICNACFQLGDPETKARARREQRISADRTALSHETFEELVRQATEVRAGLG